MRTLLAAVFIVLTVADAFAQAHWQSAADRAARRAPETRIVVLDIASGRILAAHNLAQAAQTLAAPGSTLKPLVLYQLLANNRWSPAHRVACNHTLTVAGHRLACSHPQAPSFNAQGALTWSCNSYFAEVARTLGPGDLATLLRPTGLLGATGLVAQEAAAEFRAPRTVEDEQLALLGVAGVRVTPLELAMAYRWLARALAANADTAAALTITAGLTDSASFGIAAEAGAGAIAVAGKTGTAEDPHSAHTHGWFAGLAPAAQPQVVVVVFLPASRGADAAHIAGVLLGKP